MGRAAVLTVLAGGAVLWTAPLAAAHPFGPPQTARLTGFGSTVEVRWTAKADDLTALGLYLGVLGSPRTFVYDRGVLVAEESDPGDAALLADSAALPDYLLDRIGVRQGEVPCSGSVAPIEDLAAGAQLSFSCPLPVEQVDVQLALLTDVHPSYRTFASSAGGQRAVYTAEESTHTWQLAAASSGAAQAWLALPAGGLAAAGVLGLVRWRRRAARAGAR